MVDASTQPQFCACTLKLNLKSPRIGQRVRVTMLKEIVSWDGPRRVVIAAGTVYEGVVVGVDHEGFFDMLTDVGQRKGYYIEDATIRVERLEAVNAA